VWREGPVLPVGLESTTDDGVEYDQQIDTSKDVVECGGFLDTDS